MLKNSKAYSGFAVDDLEQAREFYSDTLGLDVLTVMEDILIQIGLDGERSVAVYHKPDFVPATYTILNFPVKDVDAAVEELSSRGIEFERYDGLEQDEKGISRGGGGPEIAWFTDPAGNILSVHSEV